jgi:uncharacterized protein (TIGR00255 family)
VVTCLIKSMTGFGQGTIDSPVGRGIVEIRSVNHRYLDVEVRAPRFLRCKEPEINKILCRDFKRGRLQVYISFEASPLFEGVTARIDRPYVVAYHKALRELVEELGIKTSWEEAFLSRASEFISLEESTGDETVWLAVKTALEKAITDLARSRSDEGERLTHMMEECIVRIDAYLSEIERLAPGITQAFRTRLESKLEDLLLPDVVDPARLAAEVLIFAERCDITEEITRARSHLESIKAILKTNDVAGRKMEFTLQELLREVNTLGSKSNDYGVSCLAVEIKGELEKLREQAQNIE